MRVELSGQRLAFPDGCPCCGGAADALYTASASKSRGKRVVHTTTREWSFPYCSACLSHVSAAAAAAWPGIIGGILGLILAFGTGVPALIVCLIIGVALSIYLHAEAVKRRKKECVALGPAVRFVGWHRNLQVFDISSAQYAARFLAANERRAVNLTPEIRTLLHAARPTASTPSRARHPEPPRDEASSFVAWVSKLESRAGPAARRAVLEAALKDLSTLAYRERLLLEASRIEVAAVLDKVDSLKTSTAKRRHLQAALSELKADRVPDNLQTQQIAWLEDALRELEQAP